MDRTIILTYSPFQTDGHLVVVVVVVVVVAAAVAVVVVLVVVVTWTCFGGIVGGTGMMRKSKLPAP